MGYGPTTDFAFENIFDTSKKMTCHSSLKLCILTVEDPLAILHSHHHIFLLLAQHEVHVVFVISGEHSLHFVQHKIHVVFVYIAVADHKNFTQMPERQWQKRKKNCLLKLDYCSH